jgi:hypothetical protein
MQYLMLIYDQEKGWADMPQANRDKWMEKYREFTQSIVKSGHFRAGSQLQPTSTATSIRAKNGKAVTTDGPFAETKEQLGGYYLCECKDLDEALGIAKRIPSVEAGGTIEVRPLVPTSLAAQETARLSTR